MAPDYRTLCPEEIGGYPVDCYPGQLPGTYEIVVWSNMRCDAGHVIQCKNRVEVFRAVSTLRRELGARHDGRA